MQQLSSQRIKYLVAPGEGEALAQFSSRCGKSESAIVREAIHCATTRRRSPYLPKRELYTKQKEVLLSDQEVAIIDSMIRKICAQSGYQMSRCSILRILIVRYLEEEAQNESPDQEKEV